MEKCLPGSSARREASTQGNPVSSAMRSSSVRSRRAVVSVLGSLMWKAYNFVEDYAIITVILDENTIKTISSKIRRLIKQILDENRIRCRRRTNRITSRGLPVLSKPSTYSFAIYSAIWVKAGLFHSPSGSRADLITIGHPPRLDRPSFLK
jgi:hypothetical protein